MQIPHRPVRINKLPRVKQRRVGEGIEIFEISRLPINMAPVCTKAMFILQGCYGCGETKIQFPSQCKNRTDRYGSTTLCLAAPYRASNESFRNFRDTFRHGTVFTLMKCFHCKEVTVVESPKMQFTSQCKNRTNRNGSTNYPGSCSAVLGKE